MLERRKHWASPLQRPGWPAAAAEKQERKPRAKTLRLTVAAALPPFFLSFSLTACLSVSVSVSVSVSRRQQQQNLPTKGDKSHSIAGKEKPALEITTPQPTSQSYADGSVRHTGLGLLFIEEAGCQREAPLTAPGRRPTTDAPRAREDPQNAHRGHWPPTRTSPLRPWQSRDFLLHGHSPPPSGEDGV